MRSRLQLVGDPRPLDPAVLARFDSCIPRAYRELLETWGPGRLCGTYDLPDPRGRWFELLQQRHRVYGVAKHAIGATREVSARDLAGAVVLGIARTGDVLVSFDETLVVVLCVDRDRRLVRGFDTVVAALLGAHPPEEAFGTSLRSLRGNDLGLPHTYATAPIARAEVLAAIAADDRATADALLARHLVSEIDICAHLDLATALLDPDAPGSPATRAAYLGRCLAAVERVGHGVLLGIPIDELVAAVAANREPPADVVRRVTTLIPRPAGVYVGPDDNTERELLARAATDASARVVLADHLERRGQVAIASLLRPRPPAIEPVPDAVRRGFIAPTGFPDVDGDTDVEHAAAAWDEQDRDAPIDDLLARIAALAPGVRQGFAVLVARVQLDARAFGEVVAHLRAQIDEAWPQLVLSLRASRWDGANEWGPRAGIRADLVADANVVAAAPYFASLVRAPPSNEPPHARLAHADAWGRLVAPSAEVVAAELPHLDGSAITSFETRRAVRLLQRAGDDDRVLEAYLRRFVAALPWSERAAAMRGADPRVIDAMIAVLDAQEHAADGDPERARYTRIYARLVTSLTALGDPRGLEAVTRYRQSLAWDLAR